MELSSATTLRMSTLPATTTSTSEATDTNQPERISDLKLVDTDAVTQDANRAVFGISGSFCLSGVAAIDAWCDCDVGAPNTRSHHVRVSIPSFTADIVILATECSGHAELSIKLKHIPLDNVAVHDIWWALCRLQSSEASLFLTVSIEKLSVLVNQAPTIDSRARESSSQVRCMYNVEILDYIPKIVNFFSDPWCATRANVGECSDLLMCRSW